jgi:hypothetical protein
MTDIAVRAPDAAAEPDAYVAMLLETLGSRDPLEVLAETPKALGRAVAGLTPEEDGMPERPGKWAVRHVVQHLADAELVGAFRFRMVLAHESPALPAYDQDLWANRLSYGKTQLPTALAEFSAYRDANLRLIRPLDRSDLERVMLHKERGTESLHRMILLYAGHDLVHLRQIARIRRAIGAPAADA